MGEDKFITAGNASQLSDAASACVVMDGTLASRRGLEPLGIYRGWSAPDVSRTSCASAVGWAPPGCSRSPEA